MHINIHMHICIKSDVNIPLVFNSIFYMHSSLPQTMKSIYKLTSAVDAISRISQHALAVEGPICIETIGICVAVV